jgi:predicted dehydrogenase
VCGSYEELLADPEVDAIYNPLPNSHHGPWTIKALEAGKHVLCEKPFTSNAAEARDVAAAAAAHPDLVVMEAFHYRYHPLVARMLEIIGNGEIGTVQRIETAMCFPLAKRNDIRWDANLAGGALMDAGCYPVHLLRTLAGVEPEVVTAKARLRSPGVDRRVDAELRFADGRTGKVTASMWSSALVKVNARVVGDKGELRVLNPFAPHIFNRLKVNRRRERVHGEPTYNYQLRAFTGAVLRGTSILTPPADAVANMEAIDAIYRAAGLEPRARLASTA